MERMITGIPERLGRQVRLVAAVSFVVWLLLVVFWPAPALAGYLSAFMFWAGIPLGCMAIAMMHHLTGGRWGLSSRPLMEASAAGSFMLIPLFLPIAIGMHALYPWTSHHFWTDAGMSRKLEYLNTPFFLSRALVYLVVWSLCGIWVLRQSIHGESHDAMDVQYSPRGGALGLVIYVLTTTFASIDWVGSLEPRWYSSILGLYVLVGQVVLAFSFLVLAAAVTQSRNIRPDKDRADTLADLSTMLLVFIVLHAYFAYSQFFIIWNGNMAHENEWYVHRMRGIWGGAAVLIIGLHFILPLACLLSRQIKRSGRAMSWVIALIVVGRLIETIWFVVPSLNSSQAVAVLSALLAFIVLGALLSYTLLFLWCRRIRLSQLLQMGDVSS